MVCAPDVDQVGGAAIDLGFMIGDVGSEVGVATVGLQERAVDVVAVGGGPEQGLLTVFPVVARLALGRGKTPDVNEPLGFEVRDGGGHGVAVRPTRQRTL